MRFFCPRCKKTKTGTVAHKWCDDCGTELKPMPYGNRKRKRAGR